MLVATNGYTDGASPALQRRFVPIGSYIIATEPLGESIAAALLPRGRMAFDSKNFLYYFRRDTGPPAAVRRPRRVLAADGRHDAARRRDPPARACVPCFPELADAAIDYAWGGNVAFTRDEMPHAGRLDGLYYAGGYCGHGIAMATYLGELIARRMAGEPIEHPLFDDQLSADSAYSGTPWFLPLVGAPITG